MKHLSYLLIIGVLVAIIFLQQECGRKKPGAQTSTMTTDTLYLPSKDSLVTVYKFRPAEIREVPYAVPGRVDTVKVIPDYYTLKHYGDSGVKEENYRWKWKARVKENRLDSLQLDFQNLKPDKVITNTTTLKADPRNKLFIGGQINYSQNVSGGPSLLLLTKREHLYGYSYDPFLKGHSVLLGWRVRVKK